MKKKVFLSLQQKQKLAREFARGHYASYKEAGAAYNVSATAAGRIIAEHAPEDAATDLAAQLAQLGAKVAELRALAEDLGFTVKLERL